LEYVFLGSKTVSPSAWRLGTPLGRATHWRLGGGSEGSAPGSCLTTSPRSSALIGSDPDKDAVDGRSLVGGAQLLAGLSLLAVEVGEAFFHEAGGVGMTRKVALLF